jgi:3-keto-disaccharide hydrolase
MKKFTFKLFLGIMAIVLICGAGSAKRDPLALYAELDKKAPVNTLTAGEKQKGWQLLFDGKKTDGWHGYNMKDFPDCWKIEDGSLTMKTEGGQESLDIVTDKIYGSFALSLEYKLTKGANSGVIYQIAEDPKYKFPYETGPEFQIIDHENWPDKLEDWQINGANYAMYPPLAKPYKPVGEWNHLFLVVDGNYVTQMLNDVVVVKYEKNSDEWKKLRNSGKWANFPDWGKYDEGHISLQNHGTKVYFRDIKLKTL